MNKIWIWVGIIVVVAVGAYLIFMHQSSVSPMGQISGCLTQDRVASNETSTTGDYIVIRNNQSNAEVSRFPLPTSTILVGSFGQCDVSVTEGILTNLPVGGSIDQWRYSYDGTGQKISTVLTNSSPATGPAILKIDPTNQYISFIAPAGDDNEIQIYNLSTGAQLFSKNLSRFFGGPSSDPEGLELWKGNAAYSAWSQSKGDEVFDVAAENGQGGTRDIIIDTKDWSAKVQ
jgi:hypothetical protein